MSLQVNLSSQDIAKAYNDVLNANGIDWALFTYAKGTNDLKVQSTGNGGLEELEEEVEGWFAMREGERAVLRRRKRDEMLGVED